MNYYYKQVIILIKNHLTADFGWDCNEGINRWVFNFVYSCIKMNKPAVRIRGTNVGLCLEHKDVLIRPWLLASHK